MKSNIYHLFSLIIGIAVGIAIYGSYQAHTRSYHMTTTDPLAEPEKIVEYVYVESEPEVITETVVETEYIYVPYEIPFYRELSEEDQYYLQDVAMREAESEDSIGQAMVMLCVINRASAYGMSIKQVALSDGFASSMFRSGLTPNDNCNEALAMILEGWYPKPLHFRQGQYHDFGTPLFVHGNHYFSTY